jgi:type VI protein secretion system component VasF
MHERPGDHERRIKALERRVAVLEERFREFVNARRDQEDRDSSADLSVHPGRLRVSLKNLPPWVFALAFLTLVAVVLAVLLSRPIEVSHGPLPELPSSLIPAPE